MALIAGEVTIADDGVVSGTGLARALYDRRITYARMLDPLVVPSGYNLVTWPTVAENTNLATKRRYAQSANVDADVLISYFKAHAEVSVVVSSGGLQTTPSPLTPSTATGGPLSPVTLTGTLA